MAPIKKILLLLLIFTVLAAPFARAGEYYYDLNDKKFTYEELISKPKTVLFVWATWCPTCRETVKDFIGTKKVRHDVNIIFLEAGEKRPEVLRAMKRLKVPEAMYSSFYRDPFQEIVNRFYINAVPTVIFFQNGKISKTAHTLTSGLIDQVYPQANKEVNNARHK
jgi:thiol-disulfide isomerase/thioredoxin